MINRNCNRTINIKDTHAHVNKVPNSVNKVNVNSNSSVNRLSDSISSKNLSCTCINNNIKIADLSEKVQCPSSDSSSHNVASNQMSDVPSKNVAPSDLSDEQSVNSSRVTMKDRKGEITLDEIDIGDIATPADKTKLLKLLNEYRIVLAKPGEKTGTTNEIKYKINLKNPNKVVSVPSYPIPYKYQQLLQDEIVKLRREGTIRPSLSAFNSPVLCVKKPDNSIRVCLDFRKLNSEIEINDYPLPKISDILNSLGQSKIFTTLDLKQAFLQVELADNSKPLTAFTVGNEKYEYTKLPFGMKNSPAVFQSLMAKILNNILGNAAFCYLDDVCIYSQDLKSHMNDLRNVLERLKRANLTVKLEKCSFIKDTINYLGHKISKHGISCKDSVRLDSCPRPTDVKTLQTFLGIANFFRKFIPYFSKLAAPLYQLLRKNVTFDWTEDCENAFNKLKTSLHNVQTLSHPNYSKEFILMTDASGYAIGACLAQYDENNQLKPLGYFSKTLTNTQSRYSTTKREAYGLVSSLKHFQYILLGHETTILTDHRPLISLFTKKLPADSALARWAIAIQSFQLTVKYYPGKLNLVADYLSRLEDISNDPQLKNCPVIALSDGQDQSQLDDIQSDDDCITLNTDTLTPYIPTLEEVSWSTDELKKAQKRDDHIINITEALTNKNADRNCNSIFDLHQYIILDGILYRKRRLDNNKLLILNIVVPSILMEKAIRSVHYIMHGDYRHTLFKFKLKFYHKYEIRHIKTFVEECEPCQILKGRTPRPITLKTAPIPSRPFETCSMDLLGPLSTTPNGNKYILCLIDMFSRFCILKPIENKNTITIIDCLREVFSYYGHPHTLLSDNALEFTSSALNQFCRIHTIDKKEILPYMPASNGMVERKNRQIVQLLKLYVNASHPGEWDRYLDIVSNEINNNLNETLGETPSFAFLNYDTSPFIARQTLEAIYNYDTAENLITLREQRSIQIRNIIKANIQSSRLKQHSWSNKKKKDRKIEINNRVLFKNQHRTKLDLNYLGPAIVTNIKGPNLTLNWNGKVISRIHINNVIILKNKSHANSSVR